MKLDLLEYTNTVEKTIAQFEHDLLDTNKTISHQKTDSFINFQKYHIENVHSFQHERLIHLLVTFFFAFLTVVSFIGVIACLLIYDLHPLSNFMIILNIIITITELFYIKHYYYLENNTQKLYTYTEKIYLLISKTNLQK